MKQADQPLAPGSWLGLLGGGQLGRMFCAAAQSMGFRVCVLDPADEGPAAAVADRHIKAQYTDEVALRELAALCQACTTEFENVPARSLELLAQHTIAAPAAHAVSIAQDRAAEKQFVRQAGLPVAPHASVQALSDVDGLPDDLFPGILKVARLGYDGKGQAQVADRNQVRQAFANFDQVACVLEKKLPLASELSVVVARGFDGAALAFPAAENIHRDGILAVSTVPASVDSAIAQQAVSATLTIAEALSYAGVLCVEFFVLADNSLVVNELAPRPHNSGHYTIDACVSSQFEQQARVLARWPLGSNRQLCPSVMLNLLGDCWFAPDASQAREPDWLTVLGHECAKLHLYGKREARLGRKMGHVTVLGDSVEQARAVVDRIADDLLK